MSMWRRNTVRFLRRIEQCSCRKRRRRRACLLLHCQVHNFPDFVPQRIIFGSCSDENEDQSYWRRIRQQNPDLVVLMGDNVYGKHGLEEAYKRMDQNQDFATARKELCILATLDDNDSGGCTDTAVKLFSHFFQPTLVDPSDGVYQVYQWTDQLQIILLDLRHNRSPFRITDKWGAPRKQQHLPDFEDRDKTMMGTHQWAWFKHQLQVPCRLRLVISPVQLLALGHGYECWRMLPYERERMIRMLVQHQTEDSTTFVLSGDRHTSALYQHSDGLVEITSSSLTHTVPRGLLETEHDPARRSEFCYENNFGMLEVAGQQVRIGIRSCATGEEIMCWTFPIS